MRGRNLNRIRLSRCWVREWLHASSLPRGMIPTREARSCIGCPLRRAVADVDRPAVAVVDRRDPSGTASRDIATVKWDFIERTRIPTRPHLERTRIKDSRRKLQRFDSGTVNWRNAMLFSYSCTCLNGQCVIRVTECTSDNSQ